jgi:lipoic acid synthetase
MNAQGDFAKIHEMVGDMGLHTVCKSAKCPNIHECWGHGTATLMLMGNECTRACRFCAIPAGRPKRLDDDEPRRVAASLALMGLKHVVITSVNRDELPDGGAAIWAETIERVHEACPGMSVEVLVGDFLGDEKAIQVVCDARPEIISHNMETVHRMHPAVRPQAKPDRKPRPFAHFGSRPKQLFPGRLRDRHDGRMLEPPLHEDHGEPSAAAGSRSCRHRPRRARS